MRSRLLASVFLLGLSAGVVPALAQDNAPPRGTDEPALHTSMTPEQRTARRAEMKAKWDAMTPEQKAAKRAERKAKWDAMTPEQKAAAKERRMQRRAAHGAGNVHDQGAGDGRHVTDEVSPGQAKSNRAHLREGQGISRPAGVDETTPNQ